MSVSLALARCYRRNGGATNENLDMVLEDVTELYERFRPKRSNRKTNYMLFHSDYSGSNIKLPKILLNGNNICMVLRFPRTDPDHD